MQNADKPVVVITGASSGIGRATALRLAKRAVGLVLVARRLEPLRELGEECQKLGARTLVVVADTRDEGAMDDLARVAVDAFGRIDVWVNNAAVGAFGFFEDLPSETFRGVIETNLFGYVHGARAALGQFRHQGHGLLVNVGSLASRISTPYASAYVASKHAVRGFGRALRQELQLLHEQDIHVCTVMPASIDTPFFQHAANYAGRKAKAMPPVYPPERVARTIEGLLDKPKREVFVGSSGRFFGFLDKFVPGFVERAFARSADREHLSRHEEQEPTDGAVFEPMEEGTGVSGGWKTRGAKRLVKTAALGAAAVAGWNYVRPRYATRH